MRYQTLNVKGRDASLNSGELKRRREQGDLPAVLSRRGADTLTLCIDTAQLQKAVRQSGVGGIMELIEEDGSKHLGLLKELQWHPITRKLRHASFQEVKRDQVVTTTVPMVFVGEPHAVREKTGQFIKTSEQLEIHGQVSKLPDHVTVDISGMQVGDVLTAGAIPLPSDISAVHPDSAICTLTPPTVVEIEIPTAETDAVGEVEEIGEKAEPESEEKQ